ncbi:MAG: transcriptional regulator [Desulfobacterales bacterium]|nr:MAG: transcriptional regulator [Desulfobacterales bacterium]
MTDRTSENFPDARPLAHVETASASYTSPEIPPDTIVDQVLIAIRRMTQAIDLHSRCLTKKCGLTTPQLIVLKEISRRSETSVSQLAKAISLSQSTVTGILTRLENRGLVIRRRSTADKRRVLVRISDGCARFLQSAPPPLQEQFFHSFQTLEDWEQMMILSALQRIVSLMDADNLKVAPILTTGPIDGGVDGVSVALMSPPLSRPPGIPSLAGDGIPRSPAPDGPSS